MRLRLLVNVSLLFLLAAAALAVDAIGPGSVAPKLQLKRWLKGTPISQIDPKKTYVVEFWATWCGPCIESIPHVTELAKQNTDVTFIGVGIWEEDEGDKLDKFVKDMGDKMSYNVAYSGNKDGMAQTWMEAASQNGIPTAFVVKDRKIVWIGHPMGLDKPLAEIKAGTFDAAAFKKQFDKRAEINRQRMAVDKAYTAIVKQWEEGKREEARQALVKLVDKHPDLAQAAERLRYDWLADEDTAAWEVKTKAMLETGNVEEMKKVASFALSRAQKPEGAAKARAAIALVLKANKQEDYLLFVYARSIYLKLGDTKEALDVTSKMLEILPKTEHKDNQQLKDNLLKSKAELEAKLKSN